MNFKILSLAISSLGLLFSVSSHAITYGTADCTPENSTGMSVLTNCLHPGYAFLSGFDSNNITVPGTRASLTLISKDQFKYVFILEFNLLAPVASLGISFDGKIEGDPNSFDTTQFAIGDIRILSSSSPTPKDIPVNNVGFVLMPRIPDTIALKWGDVPPYGFASVGFFDELVKNTPPHDISPTIVGYGLTEVIAQAGSDQHGKIPITRFTKEYVDAKFASLNKNYLKTTSSPSSVVGGGVCTADLGAILYGELIVGVTETISSGNCIGSSWFSRTDVQSAQDHINCVIDPYKTIDDVISNCNVEEFIP